MALMRLPVQKVKTSKPFHEFSTGKRFPLAQKPLTDNNEEGTIPRTVTNKDINGAWDG